MSESIGKIFSNLGDNPYFGAGFGLVGVGAGIAAARQAVSVGLIVFKRHCMMTLEVTHRDQAYPWLLNWLTHYHKSAQHLSVVSNVYRRSCGNIVSQFNFVPSVGTHFLQFNNKWIKVERDRQQTVAEPFEALKFTCFGNDKKIFTDMLNYATDLELSKHEGRTVIYEARSSSWEPFGEPRRRRDFNSVILDQNVGEKILSDVQEFLSSRDWYQKRGVPYRRGYLLHGPPGCGKTSYITALAGKLEYDICQMNLSDSALADDRLSHFLNTAPPHSIILLEDIDAALMNREDIDYKKVAYQGLRKLTLSGILNVIDGVASSEERILFMTTNYPDRLDSALTRPGRVDMKVYVGYATEHQLKKAFERFYPISEHSEEPSSTDFINVLKKFCKQRATELGGLKLTMAEVQSYFLLHKNQPTSAIDNAEDWLGSKYKGNVK